MNKENNIDLDKGMYIGESDNEDIFIDWKELAGNLSVIGDSRVGKTRLMASMMRQCILKGDTLIIIDPKSSADNEIVSWIKEFAIEANREEDIIYINPMNQKDSMAFNPLHGLSNEEISSNMSNKLSVKDDFYIAMAYQVSFAISSALEFIDKYKIENIVDLPLRKFITFKDIHRFLGKYELSILLDTVKDIEISENNNMTMFKGEKDSLIKLLNGLIEKDEIYFLKLTESLSISLNQLSTGDIGNILCKEKRNPLIGKLEKGHPIIIVQPYSLKYKNTSKLLVRSFIDTLVFFYNRTLENNYETEEVFLFIDEASTVLFPGIENLFNKAGGLGLRTITFSQSFEESKSFSLSSLNNIISDNMNINIYMKSNKQEFILTYGNKKLAGVTKFQDDPNYLLNIKDLYSNEINDVFNSFKAVIDDKILRNIVKKGLCDIIKYNFSDEKSIRLQSKESEYFRVAFPNDGMLHEDINLKKHSIDVFSVAIKKYNDIQEKAFKKKMIIPMISALFHDFGKSSEIKLEYVGEDLANKYRKHEIISKIYIEDGLSLHFKNYPEIMDEISWLVENHHSTKSKIKKDPKFSFLITSNHKARQLEIDTIKDYNRSLSFRENFNTKLNNKVENDLNKRKEALQNQIIMENKTKIIHKSNKLYIYVNEKIDEIINKKSISRVGFNYGHSDGIPVRYVDIHLDNGQSVFLRYVSQEVIDSFLDEEF